MSIRHGSRTFQKTPPPRVRGLSWQVSELASKMDVNAIVPTVSGGQIGFGNDGNYECNRNGTEDVRIRISGNSQSQGD